VKSKTALIVGAGLGGLSAAATLAVQGFKVEVIEKNDKIGGKLNVVKKDGFLFDMGPSILTMPQYFRALFTAAGKDMKDYVEIVPLDPHWRNFFEDGQIIDLPADANSTAEANPSLTEEDQKQITSFLAYAEKMYEFSDDIYFKAAADTTLDVFRYYGPLKSLRKADLFATMSQRVEQHIKNPKLVDIYNYFIKYVGSSPYQAPSVLNLLSFIQYEFGLWYVKGGMYNLAKALGQLLHELGVTVRLNTGVKKITHTGQMVQGLVLNGGETLTADVVVCNMEFIPAYERLLGESKEYLARYRQFEPACSGFVAHLGVNRNYSQLRHHNFFFSRDARKHFNTNFVERKLPEDPTIYLVAPSKSDPGIAPEGHEVIKILPHIPYIQDKPFSEEDYVGFKNRVYDKLERMGLTDLRKHIVTEETWTPHDIEAHYYSNRGSIYGVVSDRKKNRGFKGPKRSRKYKNLYFVGGSINPGGGMPMAVLCGQQVGKMVVEEFQK
jgi:diapolycopene oxygenase